MGTTATTLTGAIAEHESDISTLNNQIATNYDNITYTKLSDINSALDTLAGTLSANQTKFIRIHTGTDTSLSPFTAWNDFIGYMQKQSSGYWIATLVGRDGVDVTVTNNNGTINAYSLSNQMKNTCFTDHTSKSSYTIPLTGFTTGNYWIALMYSQISASAYGLYLIFMNTSDAVTITPIINNGGRTFTGQRSGNTIIITAGNSETVWGGIRVITMN
jgi:hypothetical protein